MLRNLLMLLVLLSCILRGSIASAADEVLPAGSYIIPMTTTDQGGVNVLRGYGLVYKLLEEGIRVKWVINPSKAHDGIDVTVSSYVRGASPSTAVSRSYRGGPFVIAQEDVAAAHPHVLAFQAAHGTVVHVSNAAATYPVERTLRFAPRIGVIADGEQAVSYAILNAARIPTSAGATWSNTSNPDLLTTAQIAGPHPVQIDGALFDDELFPVFCHVGSMHSSSSVLTTPVLREIRAMLQQPQTSVLAQCDALETYEDDPIVGNFMTTTGLVLPKGPSGRPSTPITYNGPSNPLMQFNGSWGVVGGSVGGFRPIDAWLPGATPLLTGNNSIVGVAYRHIDNDPTAGRIVYLGGHEYKPGTLSEIPGARVYLNAIFEARCADLTFAPDVILGGNFEIDLFGEFDLDLGWVNIGDGFGRGGTLVLDVPVGVDFLSTSDGGVWDPGSRTITWALGAIPLNDNRGRTARFAGTLGEHTFDAELSWRVGTNVTSTTWTDLVDITMDLDGDGCLDHEEVDDFGTDPTDPTDCGPCTKGTDTCDANATCSNLPGNDYTCTCNPGYSGDGYTCTLDLVALQDTAGSIGSGNLGGVSHNLVSATSIGGGPVGAADVSYAVLHDGGIVGLSVASNGDVVVPAGTPAGSREATVQACSTAFPTNCDDAKASITVGAADLSLATNAGAITSGNTGGNAGSFLAGALLDGAAPGPGQLTSLAIPGQDGSGATASGTGEVIVPAGTPAGTYNLTVRACEALNPSNCATAPFTLTVGAAEIVLASNSGSVASGNTGGNAGSMFAGTTLDGSPVSLSQLTGLAILDADGSGATLSASGNVLVPAGTPAGTYSLSVRGCEALNPTNCRDGVFTLSVGPGALVLLNNAGSVASGNTGGNAGSMLTGATLDGSPVVAAELTDLAILDDDGSGATLSASGNVLVPAGTPAGTFSLTVQACEDLNPTNCRMATFTLDVGSGVLLLADTDGTVSSGREGGVAGSMLTGATLDAVPVSDAELTSLKILDDDSSAATVSATGLISAAPGTPQGTYRIAVEACEDLNPTNCDQATFTLQVGAALLVLPDGGASVASGASGGTAGSFTAAATLDGAPAPFDDLIDVAITNAAGSGATLSAGGVVQIPAGTPAGTYNLAVRACEALNPTNCDTATWSVQVGAAALVLGDTNGAIASGRAGGNAGSMLAQATIDGMPAAPGQLTNLAVVASAGTGATVNASGEIIVPSGVPQGSYPLTVRACEALNPSNCSSATFSLEVGAAVIAIAPGSGTVGSGASGGSAGSFLVGATLDGQSASSSAYGDRAILDDDGSGATLGSGGNILVPPGTPAGTYTLAVRACEALNPTNCAQSTFTVEVGSGTFSLPNGAGEILSGNLGGNAGSGVANATIDGQPIDVSDLTHLAVLDSDGSGATLNSAGEVIVPPGTQAGSYALTLRACEALNDTNCDRATFSLEVGAGELLLTNNAGLVPSGHSGGTAGNLLTGATLDAAPVGVVKLAGIKLLDDGGSGAALTAEGDIVVAPGTAAGAWLLTGEACEALNPTNCATATFALEVGVANLALSHGAGAIPSGNSGGTAGNLLVGATLDGGPADAALLTLAEVVDQGGTGATATDTGDVIIPAGTPAGTYLLIIRACEALNPTNCSNATFSVEVGPGALLLPNGSGILASGHSGGTAGNALAGATLDGNAAAPDQLTGIELLSDAGSGASLAPDGTVTIPPGTPAGTIDLQVRACEKLNPTNCATTTFTVTVGEATIGLVEGRGGVASGNLGGAAGNVLAGATLDGEPALTGQLTPPELIDDGGSRATLAIDGALTVPPGVAADTYTVTWRTCEALNPTNCATATFTVDVGAGVLLVPDGTADISSGNLGGSAGNALDGATLDGEPVAAPEVIATLLDDDDSGATVALDGAVSFPAGTPAGTYAIVIEVCETLNPTNCTLTTVYVEVGFAELIATDDVGTVGSGLAGGSAANVLSNDTLDGAAVPLAKVIVTVEDDGGLTGASVVQGILIVPPGTPSGTYTLLIEVCEVLNPGNCDTSIATIAVGDASLVARDDVGGVPSGHLGGIAGNVLLNDTLDGAPVTPSDVTAALVADGGLSGLTLLPSGELVVPFGTPSATYNAQVLVCEVANPTNCDTSFAAITVGLADLQLQDDAGSVSSGRIGGIATNILLNDTLDGGPLVGGLVNIYLLDNGTLTGVAVTPDGLVVVPPGTPSGAFQLLIEICEALNPTANCAASIADIFVGAAALDVEDDLVFTVISGPIGQVLPGLIDQISIDEDPTDEGDVTFELIDNGGIPGLIVEDDGTIIVPAPTLGGDYVVTIEVCEQLNPDNCLLVDVTIEVGDGTDVDTDGDGLSDYDEVYVYGTDPLDPDTDGDGCSDGDEVLVFGTDPLDPTDCGEGLTDTGAPADTDDESDTDEGDLDTGDAFEGPGTDTANPDDGLRPGLPDGTQRRVGVYSGGCGCSVPGSPPAWWLFLGLAWLPLRRRR